MFALTLDQPALIPGLLAVLVWTRRASPHECADTVRATGFGGDATWSWFGRDIEITTPWT